MRKSVKHFFGGVLWFSFGIARLSSQLHFKLLKKNDQTILIYNAILNSEFLDCNGKIEDTFDLSKMVLAPNANVDESKDELYPFFINEAAYYEKGFGFAVAKKCVVEF